ncbi:MAG: hypothetical protein HY549_08540, partial [Elusimicrobia bacterium]|nr:hypothetical protein [Elusimicrobiota bacterium]
PFFTTKVNRMGAGLSWVRKIAQSHGGSIQVENASRGVEFSLCIPAKR